MEDLSQEMLEVVSRSIDQTSILKYESRLSPEASKSASSGCKYWDSRVDLSDALDLARRLELQIIYDDCCVTVRTGVPHKYGASESLGIGTNLATCRAIARVAYMIQIDKDKLNG